MFKLFNKNLYFPDASRPLSSPPGIPYRNKIPNPILQLETTRCPVRSATERANGYRGGEWHWTRRQSPGIWGRDIAAQVLQPILMTSSWFQSHSLQANFDPRASEFLLPPFSLVLRQATLTTYFYETTLSKYLPNK